jgi:hypothetical protein
MATALAERNVTAELAALAGYVAAVADHNQIAVRAGGVLDEPRGGHAAGTAYVTVTVPTVAAAEVAAARLGAIARLDDSAWANSWRLIDGPALAIDIYPDVEAAEGRAFVEDKLAEWAARRPELEALVRAQLVDAPDVRIVGSGEEDGRGYVDIRVAAVDGADRAETALAAVTELNASWRGDGTSLVTRVYL